MDILARASTELATRRGAAALRSDYAGVNPLSLGEWLESFAFNGISYPVIQTSMGSVDRERIFRSGVPALVQNSAVSALVLARMQVFSQIRFQWTRFSGSQAGDLFGSTALSVLEKPWPNGSTADLLSRMEMDASAAGNSYIYRARSDLLGWLRPDWVVILLGSQTDAEHPNEAPDCEIAGYAYLPPSGKHRFFGPEEVAHYAPIPDPFFRFLGMSWITPVIREIQGDSLMEEHKLRFFENGAPQPLDAKVLTPSGWTTMGQLQLGGSVIGSDGRAHRITGVFPQGEQEIYRVTFSDGAQTECTADHLWQVASHYDRKRGVSRTASLRSLIDGGLRYRSGPAKWSVPLAEPAEFDFSGDLPVEPYLLGALLGDGSFRGNGRGSGGVSLAAAAEDADEMESGLTWLLPAGMAVSRRDRGGWSELYFKSPGQSNPLTSAIRLLGLWNVCGQDKFIPDRYMRAAVIDRVALLQGLIDTDGSVDRRQPNLVTFTSTSERLSRQLAELVGSLGGIGSVARRDRAGAKPQWKVTIRRLPEWITPVRLSRKAARYAPPSGRAARWRYIVSAEPVGRKQAQCIRVDSADSLYVTDGYILTHNTPNMVVKFDPSIGIENVKKFKDLMEEGHRGVWNAYKTLYLGGGADATVVGSDFRQIDFTAVQGKGESRLAAAAGVPPSWVGFSEGLQGSSLNAGNFDSARRRFSDGTMTHLWTAVAGALSSIVDPPDGNATLWYDTRIPFMRQDEGDLAKIQQMQAVTIGGYVKEGFTAESSVAAVVNNDPKLLVHTGRVSVQLWDPGADSAGHPGTGDSPAAPAGAPAPPPAAQAPASAPADSPSAAANGQTAGKAG